MATYLILNIVFLVVTVVLLASFRSLKIGKKTFIIGVILMILTVIFDSMIINSEIVGYDKSRLLGLYAYKAPLEDFFYTIFAVIAVPSIWFLTRKIGNERNN